MRGARGAPHALAVRPPLAWGPFAWGLLAWSLACGTTSPQPEATGVEPSTIREGEAVELTVRGRNFQGRARVDLGRNGPLEVDARWWLEIAGYDPQPSLAVTPTALRFQPPENLGEGQHLLEVVSPGGERIAVGGGLDVRPAASLDPGDDESCQSSCRSGCSAGDCCVSRCSSQGCAPCPSGCSCEMQCSDLETCQAVCEPSSSCALEVRSAGASQITCAEGARCQVTCSSVTACEIGCESDADCELDCANAGRCALSCAPGARCLLRCAESTSGCSADCDAPVDCGGGLTACGRACPSGDE